MVNIKQSKAICEGKEDRKRKVIKEIKKNLIARDGEKIKYA